MCIVTHNKRQGFGLNFYREHSVYTDKKGTKKFRSLFAFKPPKGKFPFGQIVF
jgi:hypothetical protein